jgi:hypothetical protein
LLIDTATGVAKTVYAASDPMPIGVDADLSTPQRLALPAAGSGESCDTNNNGSCDPGTTEVIDLATLDVASGVLTKHAIHVTITP